MKVDIFVGDFEMCHRIPLEERLKFDPVTIPLAELFLSKAQILELNRKDVLDLTSILFNNETGNDDVEKINLKVITQLCSQDWGLYKTTSINLKRVEGEVSETALNLTQAERDLIMGHVSEIYRAFEAMPKSLAWQMRDKVGTRVRWYEEVEEVDRAGRTVTIRAGNTVQAPIYAGPDMPIFDQLNRGDLVTIRYYDAFIVELTPGAKMAPLKDTTEEARQKLDRPDATVLQQVTLVVTIDSVEPLSGMVTYHGVDNRRVQRLVQQRQLLEGVKAGDVVTIRQTRAQAVGIEKR
jgi:hypothetical protein